MLLNGRLPPFESGSFPEVQPFLPVSWPEPHQTRQNLEHLTLTLLAAATLTTTFLTFASRSRPICVATTQAPTSHPLLAGSSCTPLPISTAAHLWVPMRHFSRV